MPHRAPVILKLPDFLPSVVFYEGRGTRQEAPSFAWRTNIELSHGVEAEP